MDPQIVDMTRNTTQDLHEEFYGKRPNLKLTEDEKLELEELDEDEWEEVE